MHLETVTALAGGAASGRKVLEHRARPRRSWRASSAAQAALNAFITVEAEPALAAAAAADRRLAAGERGPLTGVPIAHKDIFCAAGSRTTCGSKMLSNFVSPYDATVVARLQAAGAVTLGKTNMDEFAMGSSNETSYFGPVRNPWDPKLRAGRLLRRLGGGGGRAPGAGGDRAPTPAARSASPRRCAA